MIVDGSQRSEAWEQIELGQLAQFRNGLNFTSNAFGSGLPIINVGDFGSRSVPDYASLGEIDPRAVTNEEAILKHDDLVAVRSNGNRELIGRSMLIKKPPRVTHSAFTIRIRVHAEGRRRLLPEFLAYTLRGPVLRAALSSQGSGTNISNLNQGILERLPLRLPPLPVQRKIAAILSAYDDLIENNNLRMKILEEMAQRIYREWFVDFRYPGHENVQLVGSELGPIPDGWRIQPFAALGEYVNGYAFKPGDWGSDGIPIVKIRELKNGVTEETPRYAGDIGRKYVIHDGDLLFSWSADLDAYLWTGGQAWLNQHLFRVDPVPGIPSAFLFHALRERMTEFRGRAQGTTMRHIKRSALGQVKTVVPTEAKRNDFADLVGPVDRMNLELVRATRNLRSTRDLLLPRLISGEVDVTDLDIAVREAAA